MNEQEQGMAVSSKVSRTSRSVDGNISSKILNQGGYNQNASIYV